MNARTDIAIIGAGPAGALAAGLLRQRGHQVTVLERAVFPRFSIGESLLPQCMEFIAEAGMLEAINKAGFQFKNGAAFLWDGRYCAVDFEKKFGTGPGSTFQVQRADFDLLLAEEAAKAGADIRFGHAIEGFGYDSSGNPQLQIHNPQGEAYELNSSFVLDASGFGRVLPRLLDLELPSSLPPRMSIFTHIEDRITDPQYDRNKILIAIHPERRDQWYWLIPFSNGRCSLGVVGEPHFFDQTQTPVQRLREAVAECNELATLLTNARFDTQVNVISGYSCKVKSLWGKGYVLLGNAGEFLDPVFSSGVTIAMKSASLAAAAVDQALQGKAVDWDRDYAQPLQQGVDTFRTYVTSWYDGGFQDVLFADHPQQNIQEMIAAILAGYAWDTTNPLVKEPQRRLNALIELCQ